MSLKKFIPSFVIILFFVSTAFLINSSDDDTQNDWKDYRSWHKLTEEPTTGDPTGLLFRRHGGTAGYRNIYVNEIGKQSYTDSSFPYPVGTIIVKEVYKNEKKYLEDNISTVSIMLKLEEGTSPETGDWEYIEDLAGKKRGSGTSASARFCGSCHRSANKTDFVFSTPSLYSEESE